MTDPDLTRALLEHGGYRAGVVLIALMVAVGLAVFVIDVFDGLKKKERDE